MFLGDIFLPALILIPRRKTHLLDCRKMRLPGNPFLPCASLCFELGPSDGTDHKSDENWYLSSNTIDLTSTAADLKQAFNASGFRPGRMLLSMNPTRVHSEQCLRWASIWMSPNRTRCMRLLKTSLLHCSQMTNDETLANVGVSAASIDAAVNLDEALDSVIRSAWVGKRASGENEKASHLESIRNTILSPATAKNGVNC